MVLEVLMARLGGPGEVEAFVQVAGDLVVDHSSAIADLDGLVVAACTGHY